MTAFDRIDRCLTIITWMVGVNLVLSDIYGRL
jgi:hypothetical protein